MSQPTLNKSQSETTNLPSFMQSSKVEPLNVPAKPLTKSALIRQGSKSKMKGPREFSPTIGSLPARPKKAVTFDRTDEVIQYDTLTPEPDSADAEQFSWFEEPWGSPEWENGLNETFRSRPLPQVPQSRSEPNLAMQNQESPQIQQFQSSSDEKASSHLSPALPSPPAQAPPSPWVAASPRTEFHRTVERNRLDLPERVSAVMDHGSSPFVPGHRAQNSSIASWGSITEQLLAPTPASPLQSEISETSAVEDSAVPVDTDRQFRFDQLPSVTRKESLLDSQRRPDTQHVSKKSLPQPNPADGGLERSYSKRRRSILSMLDPSAANVPAVIEEEPHEDDEVAKPAPQPAESAPQPIERIVDQPVEHEVLPPVERPVHPLPPMPVVPETAKEVPSLAEIVPAAMSSAPVSPVIATSTESEVIENPEVITSTPILDGVDHSLSGSSWGLDNIDGSDEAVEAPSNRASTILESDAFVTPNQSPVRATFEHPAEPATELPALSTSTPPRLVPEELATTLDSSDRSHDETPNGSTTPDVSAKQEISESDIGAPTWNAATYSSETDTSTDAPSQSEAEPTPTGLIDPISSFESSSGEILENVPRAPTFMNTALDPPPQVYSGGLPDLLTIPSRESLIEGNNNRQEDRPVLHAHLGVPFVLPPPSGQVLPESSPEIEFDSPEVVATSGHATVDTSIGLNDSRASTSDATHLSEHVIPAPETSEESALNVDSIAAPLADGSESFSLQRDLEPSSSTVTTNEEEPAPTVVPAVSHEVHTIPEHVPSPDVTTLIANQTPEYDVSTGSLTAHVQNEEPVLPDVQTNEILRDEPTPTLQSEEAQPKEILADASVGSTDNRPTRMTSHARVPDHIIIPENLPFVLPPLSPAKTVASPDNSVDTSDQMWSTEPSQGVEMPLADSSHSTHSSHMDELAPGSLLNISSRSMHSIAYSMSDVEIDAVQRVTMQSPPLPSSARMESTPSLGYVAPSPFAISLPGTPATADGSSIYNQTNPVDSSLPSLAEENDASGEVSPDLTEKTPAQFSPKAEPGTVGLQLDSDLSESSVLENETSNVSAAENLPVLSLNPVKDELSEKATKPRPLSSFASFETRSNATDTANESRGIVPSESMLSHSSSGHFQLGSGGITRARSSGLPQTGSVLSESSQLSVPLEMGDSVSSIKADLDRMLSQPSRGYTLHQSSSVIMASSPVKARNASPSRRKTTSIMPTVSESVSSKKEAPSTASQSSNRIPHSQSEPKRYASILKAPKGATIGESKAKVFPESTTVSEDTSEMSNTNAVGSVAPTSESSPAENLLVKPADEEIRTPVPISFSEGKWADEDETPKTMVTPELRSSVLTGPSLMKKAQMSPAMQRFQESRKYNTHDALPHERGRLFVRIDDVTRLVFPDIETKKAQLTVTLDNGLHCITTPSRPMSPTTLINEEFEVVVQDDLSFVCTLRASWKRSKTHSATARAVGTPTTQPSDASKTTKSRFGRLFKRSTKPENVVEPVEKPVEVLPEQDNWGSFVASDGSFGRGIVHFSDVHRAAFGKPHKIELVCHNEWADQDTPSGSSMACILRMTMMFVPRMSRSEILPSTMEQAFREIALARQSVKVVLTGYMTQAGGDCISPRRRYFVLDDDMLVAHSDSTHKPRVTINLRKANQLIPASDNDSDFSINFTNGDSLQFRCEKGATREEWLGALDQTMRQVRTRSPWLSLVIYGTKSNPVSGAKDKQSKRNSVPLAVAGRV